MKGNSKKFNFFLSMEDLEKHMFICGATGTGKSNFLQHFLLNFNKKMNIPFFLVEFKGEYHFLQKKINDLLILWPGENFSINIFNPEDSDPIIHAERIFDILKSGKFLEENSEYSPQMEKVLVEILAKVCRTKKCRNWEGFKKKCEEYLKENKEKIPMLNQTLISIKNRIRRFSNGPLKRIFEINNELNVNELFKRNIILDLSSIIRLGGEKEDALFFLNMILKYLWDTNLSRGAHDYKGIRHLTIIEDAQYFAPQDQTKKNKITTYLEDIALLQRGTGECLITLSTRPNISKEILANNGIVLTFKNHIEKDIMCELLNLDNENKNFLSILERGQCIVRINSIKEPFLLLLPYIKREKIKVSEINKNNQNILNRGSFISGITNQDKNLINILKKLYTFFKNLKSKIKNYYYNKDRSNVNQSNKKLCLNNVNHLNVNDIKSKEEKILFFNDKIKKNNEGDYIDNKNQKIFLEKQYNNKNKKLNINTIFEKFISIKNFYDLNKFERTIIECCNLIEFLLEEISLKLGFNYKNIEHFINNLTKLKLEKKFIFYKEIIEFSSFLNSNNKEIENQKSADFLFSITKKIIAKLKTHINRKRYKIFTSGY
ncbi:MAG: ATP-binding protein, partial [Promethearchaeota archaeon]